MTKSWGEIVREIVGEPIGPVTGLYQGRLGEGSDVGGSQLAGRITVLLLAVVLIVSCLCGIAALVG